MPNQEVLLAILERARWAPSGDNVQPARFELLAPDRLAVHAFDTRDSVVYDFQGHASHLAHGALLESIAIAASAHQLQARWELRSTSDDRGPIYDVEFSHAPGLIVDPLEQWLDKRVVQRRPMRLKSLTTAQRQAIVAAVGAGFTVALREDWRERLRLASLLWDNAGVRLRCPEAYPVHKEVIDWGKRYSKDKIPEQAVGVDPATAKLMRWVMEDWKRVRFFNRYLLGTVAPRIQLDFLPAFFCSAHVLLTTKQAPASIVEWVEAGRAVQRLWLTVASLGLYLQPQMTPLIFSWYAKAGIPLSAEPEINDAVRRLNVRVREELVPADQEAIFFARVGFSNPPRSRSLRMDLESLLVPPSSPP